MELVDIEFELYTLKMVDFVLMNSLMGMHVEQAAYVDLDHPQEIEEQHFLLLE
jgi:hypothetical protein